MIEKTWLGAGVVAMSLVASGPVLAQQEVTVDASFLSVSADDCVDSEFEVFARDPNLRTSANTVSIEVSAFMYDNCQERVVLDAREKTSLSGSVLQVDGDRVTLNATVPTVDHTTNNATSLLVDLIWEGDDEPVVARTTRVIKARGRFERADRAVTRTLLSAIASGTISIDGQTVDVWTDDATIWTQ